MAGAVGARARVGGASARCGAGPTAKGGAFRGRLVIYGVGTDLGCAGLRANALELARAPARTIAEGAVLVTAVMWWS